MGWDTRAPPVATPMRFIEKILTFLLQNNLKKFMEIVCKGDADKVTEELNKGIDPNFCDSGKGGAVGGGQISSQSSCLK